MNRLTLFVCVLLASFASVYSCIADDVNGVLTEDRVINLPQDQGKWFISVVGDESDSNCQRVLGWFNNDARMRALRDATHFNPVATSTDIYRERYLPTTGRYKIVALPCVRLQTPNGDVVYQACGKQIPMTSQGLYAAIANGIRVTENAGPFRRCRPNPNPDPNPDPQPDPEPQPLEPQPPIEPVAPEVETDLPPVWLMILMLLVGAGTGVAYEWKRTYAKK